MMKRRIDYRDLSIRNKIIVMVLSVVFIIISIGFVAIGTWNINKLKKDIKTNLAINTKLIGDYCVVPLFFGDNNQAIESLSRLKFLESVEEGYLFDKHGKLFAGYPKSIREKNFSTDFEKEQIIIKDGHILLIEHIDYQNMHLGTIVVQANTKLLKATRRNMTITFSLYMLVLLLLTYIIASIVQKNISDPILHLAEQTRSITISQDFTVRLDPPGRDEIGSLYTQYNNLLTQLQKREIERDQAEMALKDLNANLEEIVQERTAKLEEANKGMEAFSYSVSHDLRAPLRHINGYLELLKKRNMDQIDEKGLHYMETISEAASRMGQLIDDLLEFSRAGRSELKRNAMSMDKVLKDAMTILEPEIKDRKIEWSIEDLPEVYADYSMIRQVWVNLIGNAIKYSKHRETATIHIGHIAEGTDDIFYVRDNGAGFDMNYAQKLFGVFQRLHSTEEFEGTGIGLANVRQIINRHKGRTWAEGEVDKGATFYFSIPKNKNNGGTK